MIFRILFLTSLFAVCSAKDVTEVLQIVRCGTIENLQKAFDGTTDPNAKNDEGTTPVLYAARENRGDMLLYLWLTQRANLLTLDQDHRNVLHWAAIKGNFAILQILENNLKKQQPKVWWALVRAKDALGLTPLHWAAQRGDKDITILLLRAGVDPNMGDAEGKTALYWASKKGHKELLQTLLDSKLTNINHKSPWGMTALHEAARGGYVEAAETLLNSGADINALDVDDRTPLYWASERGHANVVKLLLDRKANPLLLDQDRRSPLHRAARYGHTDVVKILVEQGRIPVDVQDTLQETPLCWSVLNGHIDTTKILLSLGAKLEYLKRGNHSIFHEIAAKGEDEMIAFLTSKGYNVNEKDNEGRTALDYAAVGGKGTTVKVLLNKGALEQTANKGGKDPLDYAIAGRNTDVIETLLNAKRDDQDGLKKLVFSKKINLYMTDAKGQTVLEHALAKRHIKLLTFLVIQAGFKKALPLLKSKKLNLNTLDDKDNFSMLHYTALMQQEGLAETLVQVGADVNVKEKGTGFTPLHYAVLGTYPPVLKVLLGANAAIGPKDKFEAINRQFVDGVTMFLNKGMRPEDYLGDKKISDMLISGNNTQVIETFFEYFKGDIKAAMVGANGKPVQPDKPGIMDPFDTSACLQKMQDQAGMTVAHWVAKSGHDGLLDVLFDKSKMVTPLYIAGIDKTGRTPLHYAAAGGYADIVTKLLARDESGLDIDTVSNDGTSALHEAAIHHQIPTVKKLIALGANKDLLDKNKKTAADYLEDKDKVSAGLMPPPPPPAPKTAKK